MAALNDGQPLLQTFQKHIEDMRNLVMCKICIKPLYEPFALTCGHSYCYSCLTSWFMGGDGDRRRRQNMKCPDCRAPVILEPSPNYVLRDLVHMFVSRAELLAEDETTEEHETAKKEEALQLMSDKNAKGLFKGAFGTSEHSGNRNSIFFPPGRTRPGPLLDPHDNVERCPECHWELERGRCNQCEWSISDEDSLSDDSEILSEDDSETAAAMEEIEYAIGARINRRVFHLQNRRRSPNSPPQGAFGNGSENGEGVVTVDSDVDDIDPIDHDLDAHSEAESDLPVAMGGRPRRYRGERGPTGTSRRGGYESDIQSTNYDDSEMGDIHRTTTSSMGDSDSDEDEDEEEEEADYDDSSEMDGFIEHDTPSHISSRARGRFSNNLPPEILISSDEDDSDEERDTNRESSQTPTTISTTSNTADSSSDDSSEGESRRTPVPRGRTTRPGRVIPDDSDDNEDEETSNGEDDNGDESDATTIPAQPRATRQARLQNQRARRGNSNSRQTLVSVPRRPEAPSRTGGLEYGSAMAARHHPYQQPQVTTTRRRGGR